MTNLTAHCIPGHATGSKPYIVPVAGNNDRPVPQFIVYHGDLYLDADGTVVRHPVRHTIDAARVAIDRHNEATVLAYLDKQDRLNERRQEWYA